MTREAKAMEFFSNGYNCAQATLGALCEEAGLDLNTAFKLANGFGGGVRCGELCGAVSGAVMVVGLKCGFYIEKDMNQKAYCNERVYDFLERFREVNGSLLCRELLGVDVRRPDDLSSPAAREAHKTVCPKLVASAVCLLEDMEF